MTVAGSQPWQQAGGGLAHLRLDRAAITDGCIVIDTEAREARACPPQNPFDPFFPHWVLRASVAPYGDYHG